MSNKTQAAADKIRHRLLVAGYIASPCVDGIEVESTDMPAIGKIAAATAKCTLSVRSGKTIVEVQ